MLKGTGFSIQGVNQEVPPLPEFPFPLLPLAFPAPELVVLPPPEFPELELPELELPELELPELELPELELPELELPELELPELELPPLLAPLAPACPVLPATFVLVLTWVLEAFTLALAAVLTVTLGAEVLTTVELDRPLDEVFG